MAGKRAGYSLAEVIIVVLILGALAFIAVPRLNYGVISQRKAHTVAKTLTAGLRHARTLAITRAIAHPNQTFTLSIDGLTYRINDDFNGVAVDSQTFDGNITITCGICNFKFGPLGNLLEGGNEITVKTEDKSYTITIKSGTGIVECTGG
jgi:prepilin-type N-terminal cleavage/methylation domain-containing protein